MIVVAALAEHRSKNLRAGILIRNALSPHKWRALELVICAHTVRSVAPRSVRGGSRGQSFNPASQVRDSPQSEMLVRRRRIGALLVDQQQGLGKTERRTLHVQT